MANLGDDEATVRHRNVVLRAVGVSMAAGHMDLEMTGLRARYLALLKQSLLNELYIEHEVRLLYLQRCLDGRDTFDRATFLGLRAHRPTLYDAHVEAMRRGDHIGGQHTMIGRARLENIEHCLGRVLAEAIPGDVMECGVWRGGATIFMRGYLAAYGVEDRVVWVADSFQGIPAPAWPEDRGLEYLSTWPALAVDLDSVRELFARYGLLDEQVRFLPGWFKDTLHDAPIRQLALLRLDGDLYQSTMECLTALYSKVAPGGFVIVDDYGCLPQCREAVTDFRARGGIVELIEAIDHSGVFWRKG